MPFVNGSQATQMIRALEEKRMAAANNNNEYGRIPIFAVSATLRRDRQSFKAALGFDGWLLKPVHFGRLGLLLSGAFNPDARKEGLYNEEEFDLGGWFEEK
jgi:hypothetical protein